jgi:hypothetical protein
MISHYCSQTLRLCRFCGVNHKYGCGLVAMNNLNLLSDEDLSQYVIMDVQNRWMRCLTVHISGGQIIDL